MRRGFKETAVLVLSAGTSFWGPSALVSWITRKEPSLALATLLPLAGLLGLCWITRHRSDVGLKRIATTALAGIYLTGPCWIAVSMSARNPNAFDHPWVLLILSTIPWFTFAMSAYHVFALIIATGILPILAAIPKGGRYSRS